MFVYSPRPLVLSEASLHSLYASLNAPVVQVDELPVGPVRAAIVIYAEDYGDLGLAVGLRALEGGEVALYAYRGGIPNTGEVGAALEDALHFAEGLGFLFDDNMLVAASNADRRVALEHWNQLMSAGAGLKPFHTPGDAPDAYPADPDLSASTEILIDSVDDLLSEDGAADELLLDDLALAEPLEADGEAPGTQLDADPRETAVFEDLSSGQDLQPAQAAQLTKFRGVGELDEPALVGPAPASASATIDSASVESAEPEAAEDPAPGGRALGRIPIVRKRKGGDGSRPSFVTRLLASF